MKTVLQLVKEWCANFDNHSNGIYNYCNFEKQETNMQCGYFKNEDYRCGYFEKNVLPINKESEAIYKAKILAKEENRDLSLRERKEIINEIKEENKIKKNKRKRRNKFEMKLG